MRQVDKNETAWFALVVLGVIVAVSTSEFSASLQEVQTQEQVSHGE